MNTSSLAQRLQDFEATLESLHLVPEPATRQVVASDGLQEPVRKLPRRSFRTGGIRIRDQGLRTFRVR